MTTHSPAASSPPLTAASPAEWSLLAIGYTVVEEGGLYGSPSDFDRLAAALAAGRPLAVLADPAAAPLVAPAGFACVGGAGDAAASPTSASSAADADAAAAATAEAYLTAVAGVAAAPPVPASLALAVGAAALVLVTQANFTGPPLGGETPPGPWQVAGWELREQNDTAGEPGAATAAASAALGADRATPGEAWARAARPCAASGEPAAPHTAGPLYLALALELLLRPLGLLEEGGPDDDAAAKVAAALPTLPLTWPLWAARAVATRQRLLTAPAAATRTALDALAGPIDALLASLPPDLTVPGVRGGRPLAPRIRAGAALEAAAARLDLRDAAAAAPHLDAAAAALGRTVGVGGAMGTRTVHQVEPKAQLVALLGGGGAGHDDADADADASGDEADALAAVETQAGPTAGALAGLGVGDGSGDVLPAPRLVGVAGEGGERGHESGEAPALPPSPAAAAAAAAAPPALQALLLAHAALVTRGTADDGLRGWRAAPYVEAVLGAARTRPALRRAARLATARHEAGRPRTRDRALLTLEQLVEAGRVPEPALPLSRRLPWAWAAHPAPPAAALGREAADGLLSVGLAAGALAVYEAVEAWDAVALCYRMLGKEAAAVAVVQKRLEARPGDASLLCALGDITKNETHYVAAWEASGGRCARAQRALARGAAARQDWRAARAAWRLALSLNPLHADGWFAAGFAALKLGDDDDAAAAFTRAAAEDPDNPDAWNNLAAVHLRRGRPRPALSALAAAVRLHRDGWQTWSNYAAAALAAGAPLAAARGAAKVIALTRGERREVDVLSGVVEAVGAALARERGGAGDEPMAAAAAAAAAAAVPAPAPGPSDLVDPGGLEDDDDDGGDDEEEEGGDGAAAAASPYLADAQPTAAALAAAAGAALRAAAASPGGAADPAVWTALADLNALTGHAAAAREARLRAVRCLAGSEWREGGGAFAAYAAAAAALGRAEAAAAPAAAADPGAGGTPRDLASARLLLKGVVAAGEKLVEDGGGGGGGGVEEAVEEAKGALEAVVAVM